jgi:membrane-associated protein
LLLGFFLPGDSLLFVTGLLVKQGTISTPLGLVCVLLAVAAVAGNLCGYWIGYRVGPPLFRRPNSRFFRQEFVDRTASFFDRYGPRAIVLARFVPIVRTVITAMAGTARMSFRRYAIYSVIGGVIWAVGLTLIGYWLGNVTFIASHIELIAIAIVVVSVVPIVVQLMRERNRAA